MNWWWLSPEGGREELRTVAELVSLISMKKKFFMDMETTFLAYDNKFFPVGNKSFV